MSQEDVDYSNAAALTQYDYPPRVIFEMTPSENAKPSSLQFQLTGVETPVRFEVSLLKTIAVTPSHQGELLGILTGFASEVIVLSEKCSRIVAE